MRHSSFFAISALGVAASPIKTDVVGEFVKACCKHGLAPCFSFSFVDASYEHRTGRRMFDRQGKLPADRVVRLLELAAAVEGGT